MGVVASALITELIGIHLIFGAFLLGAAMPKNAGLTRELAEKTEDFVLIFLLPIFFAYSGLADSNRIAQQSRIVAAVRRSFGSGNCRQIRRHLRGGPSLWH